MNILISDFFKLKNELAENGVFDAVITSDSGFFINLLRLKQTKIPEFKNSYRKINSFFEEIMILLNASTEKGDRFYKKALIKFSFSGVKDINLGFSSTGIDAAFGNKLSTQVISDAFDIVKAGSKQPEIFQLIGLFEENVGPDRLSDMIATLVLDDIIEYTKNVNIKLNINSNKYPKIKFENGVAFNPYKKCKLLYLPVDILHELPIAYSWEDVGRVASENDAIRNEINKEIGLTWSKLSTSDRKFFIKKFFKDPQKCKKIIESYQKETIGCYNLNKNTDYSVNLALKQMRASGIFDFLEHSDSRKLTSKEGAHKVLKLFKEFIENNKGWEFIQTAPKNKKEKFAQRLIDNSGRYFCEQNNLDLSFEPNEGPGPCDVKISRGNDKTIIEVKMSSNNDYLHGFTDQIEAYAHSEKTNNRIFVYIKNENHPEKDQKIQDKYNEDLEAGKNPPDLVIIDALPQKSASKR